MEEKKFEISESLINALLSYLIEKPYKEVWQGVEALKKLKEIKKDGEEQSKEASDDN